MPPEHRFLSQDALHKQQTLNQLFRQENTPVLQNKIQLSFQRIRAGAKGFTQQLQQTLTGTWQSGLPGKPDIQRLNDFKQRHPAAQITVVEKRFAGLQCIIFVRELYQYHFLQCQYSMGFAATAPLKKKDRRYIR